MASQVKVCSGIVLDFRSKDCWFETLEAVCCDVEQKVYPLNSKTGKLSNTSEKLLTGT